MKSHPPKLIRNKSIVNLKDISDWSFSKIAKRKNITKQRVREIYLRETEKAKGLEAKNK